MSVGDQSGKDIEIGQVLDFRKLYDDILPSGKVIISVTGYDLVDHHVVVPIPKSYEAAMAIAFGRFGEHIPTNEGYFKDACFKYWMKSPGGEVVWAELPPEFWTEIVKDGDHLKLSTKYSSRMAKITKLAYHSAEDPVVAPLPKSHQDAERLVFESFYKKHGHRNLPPNVRISMKTNAYGLMVVNEASWMYWMAQIDKTSQHVEFQVTG